MAPLLVYGMDGTYGSLRQLLAVVGFACRVPLHEEWGRESFGVDSLDEGDVAELLPIKSVEAVAVVGGGGASVCPSTSAAIKRAAIKPTLADST